MYIAAGQGQTTPGDKILISSETSCHFSHCYKFQKISLKSDFIQFFFHDFIHVYTCSPGAGADNFYVNRNILSLWSFVASFKKNLFEV